MAVLTFNEKIQDKVFPLIDPKKITKILLTITIDSDLDEIVVKQLESEGVKVMKKI